MRRNIIIGLLFLLPIIVVGVYAKQIMQRTAKAYVFGYPLVMMTVTHDLMSGAGTPDNHFRHNSDFPDHNFRDVVKPNNDTLYSVAWLDLTDEPMVLSVPDTQGRYYVMPLMDAWSNVFANIGRRVYGTKAANFFIHGPDWQGAITDEMTPIQAPTNRVWLIGRIQINGKDDIPTVTRLQNEFKLSSWRNWPDKPANSAIFNDGSRAQNAPKDNNPVQQINDMSAEEFFSIMSEQLQQQASKNEDVAIVEDIAHIGLVAEHPFDPDALNFIDRWLMQKAVNLTRKKIRHRLEMPKTLENGWTVHRQGIGNYGTNYSMRAAIAMLGLGALEPIEASYPHTSVDASGEALTGNQAYRIHFNAGETPPAEAFWSLTLYDDDGYLVENPINRYLVSDRDALHYNSDGSLDLLIQNQEPSTTAPINWLPAPKGKFELMLRIYNPEKRFLDGEWKLPLVERLEQQTTS